MVRGWNLPIFWPDLSVVREAARLKIAHRLGLADCVIAALAVLHGLTLVAKDPDFNVLLPNQLKLLQLASHPQ